MSTPLIFEVVSARYETDLVRIPATVLKDSKLTGTVPRVIFDVRQKEFLSVNPAANVIGTILFRGYCHVENGDFIRTYIGGSKETAKYTRGSFRSIEEVSRIEKITREGEVLAVFNGLPENISIQG